MQKSTLCSIGTSPEILQRNQRQLENVDFRRNGMSFFAGQHTSVCSLNHYITCRLEARQALIYQLVLGLTGKNGKYNYSETVPIG